MSYGDRWDQLKSTERLGTGPRGQSVDQTLDAVTLAGYAADGVTLTDTTLPTTGVVIGSGGSVGGVFPAGAIYGQVPRGTVDGVNRVFTLDYTLGGPFTWLSLNGIVQKPPRDGANPNPDPDYAISGNTLIYKFAPRVTDAYHYIWYIVDQPVLETPVSTAAPASATIYLTTAHYPSDDFVPNYGASASFDGVGLIFPVPTWFHSVAQWDKRTDSHSIDVAKLTDGSFFLLLMLEQATGLGSWPDMDPPDEFWIYDCYVIVTLTDATTQIWRPTVVDGNPTYGDSAGVILNMGNAIDSDPDTYTTMRVTHYTGFLNGSFLTLNTFAPVDEGVGSGAFGGSDGDPVDPINGGGIPSPGTSTGVPGNTSTADQIYGDMVGSAEGSPGGWPFGTNPVSNALDTSQSYLEWWSVLYNDATGNPATNTRIAVKNVQLWWLNTSTSTWENGFGPVSVFDGGTYNGDYSGTELGHISFTTETDGARSYGPPPTDKVDHSYAPWPRVQIDPAHYGGLVVVAEAKLVLINLGGTDDRASAKLLFEVGVDQYPTGTGPGIDNNPGLLAGQMKYVTSNYRSFAATSLSQAALEANPPPIDLTGIDP